MKTLFIFAIFCGIVAAVPAMVPSDDAVSDIHAQITKDMQEMHPHIENSLWCPICEYLVREGEDYITKNTTEEHATKFLENACHHLPKEKQDGCEKFVKDNYHNLIEHITSEESAPVACSQLHFCSQIEKQEENECNFCKYAAHRIEVFLHQNNTLQNIIEFGNNFCENIAEPHKTVCANIVPVYYHDIVGKLVDHYNFVDICETMHFCTGHTEDLEMPNVDTYNDDHHVDEHHDDEHHDEEHIGVDDEDHESLLKKIMSDYEHDEQ
jgi:hypothetical protein